MYACYTDESGHCGRQFNAKQPVEVVCGVLIDLSKLFKTQREHKLIFRFLKKHGVPIAELKASDIYGGRKGWRNVSPKERFSFLSLLLKWMASRYCKIIVCPIDCSNFFDRKRVGCSVSARLYYPYEVGALNVILAVQRFQQTRKDNKDKTFLVFDEQKGHDENLLRILEGDLEFTDGYTRFGQRKETERLFSIVDVPYFAKSHLAIAIQLADLVAFVVNKYLLLASYDCDEKYEGEFSRVNTWYKSIRECLISYTAIDPPGHDPFCSYIRSIRPSGWSARQWLIKS